MAKSSKLNIVITSTVKSGFSGISKVNKGLRKTLAITGLLSGVAGFGGFSGLGIAAVKASFQFESLKLRMEAVTGSAKRAKKVFQEVFDLFIRSPLMLEPLLTARILLEGIGVRGSKAMHAIAGASAALGKDVKEVASAIASLETEPLRRMGIEIRRDAEKGIITFRDRYDKQIKFMGNSTDELRQQLLEVFDIKFGGFLGKAAMTGSGLQSTMLGTLKALAAQFGDAFLEPVKWAMRRINKVLIDALSDGTAFVFGSHIYDAFSGTITKIIALIKKGEFGKALLVVVKPLGAFLVAAMKDAARALQSALLNVAKIVGSALILAMPRGTEKKSIRFEQKMTRESEKLDKEGSAVKALFASKFPPSRGVQEHIFNVEEIIGTIKRQGRPTLTSRDFSLGKHHAQRNTKLTKERLRELGVDDAASGFEQIGGVRTFRNPKTGEITRHLQVFADYSATLEDVTRLARGVVLGQSQGFGVQEPRLRRDPGFIGPPSPSRRFGQLMGGPEPIPPRNPEFDRQRQFGDLFRTKPGLVSMAMSEWDEVISRWLSRTLQNSQGPYGSLSIGP